MQYSVQHTAYSVQHTVYSVQQDIHFDTPYNASLVHYLFSLSHGKAARNTNTKPFAFPVKWSINQIQYLMHRHHELVAWSFFYPNPVQVTTVHLRVPKGTPALVFYPLPPTVTNNACCEGRGDITAKHNQMTGNESH